jgi:hypothetical protein
LTIKQLAETIKNNRTPRRNHLGCHKTGWYLEN